MSPHDIEEVYQTEDPVLCVDSRHIVTDTIHTLMPIFKASILLLHHKAEVPAMHPVALPAECQGKIM